LIKASKRSQAMTITSPIDGVVQTSAITTVGQVVSAGTELMRIVPSNSTLEIEAYLPNRDIGFVSAGQPAVIKVEAFPFTRFGIIEGKVTRVATDAIPDPMRRHWKAPLPRNCRALFPSAMSSACRTLSSP
jgi:hemolysin D